MYTQVANLPVSAKKEGPQTENEKPILASNSEPPVTTTDLKPTSIAPQTSPNTGSKPATEAEAPIKPGPPPLLILDLNGSLLHRQYKPGAPKIIHPRPHIEDLFQYALSHDPNQSKLGQHPIQNWEVLIWSSAQSQNVDLMCEAIQVFKRPVEMRRRGPSNVTNQLDDISNRLGSLTIEKLDPKDVAKSKPVRRQVMDIWTRSQLDLSSEDYSRKVSTTKDLRKVWKAFSWSDPATGEQLKWGPHNTVIVDDSPDKLSLQPDNLCMIDEFSGDPKDTSLLKLIEKLRSLRNEPNIAEAIKKLKEQTPTT